MAMNAPPEAPDEFSPSAPEYAPSGLTAEEPSSARTIGMVGLALVGLGVLAGYVPNSVLGAFLGPVMRVVAVFAGAACLIYHAARDSDRLVRRAYIALGIAALATGVVLSLLPSEKVGDLLIPWGAAGLLGGLVFLLAAGRHEDELPWPVIIVFLLTGVGVAATVTGMLGVAISLEYLPRLTGVALLGILFWWSAVGRLGPASDGGYRLGQLLGVVGLAAILFGVGRSAGPPLMHSLGALTQMPERYFVPRGLVLTSLGVVALLVAYGICSDRAIVAMTRRELAAYFYSPVAYLVLIGMTLVGWFSYVQWVGDIIESGTRPMREPIVRNYIISLVPVFAIMFAVPVITMRLFSEERRTGTIEVLLTAPVNEVSVVLSKFFAALIYFLVLVIPWGLLLVPVYNASRLGFDYLPLMSFYVAFLASGAAFVSMGLFFSSLTRNQIIAAALTFAGMVAYLSIYFVAFQSTGATRSVLEQFSFIQVWFSALNGRLYLHNVITYLSITAFWLFLTVKVLEARKWS